MLGEAEKGSTEPPAIPLGEPPPKDNSWLEMEAIRGGDEEQIDEPQIDEPRTND